MGARLARGVAAAGIAAAVLAPFAAGAAVTFQVSFDDPGAQFSAYYDRIRSNVVSAGNEWASYFGASYTASLQVQLSFADIATSSGASVTNAYVGTYNGVATYEQGAAYEVLTGLDPNGSAPDIHITLGRSYLTNELWFDPSPNRQTTKVPSSRTDARSVFLHELGHGFAFNGWRDGVTGALPGGYQSTFDALVTTSLFNGQPQSYFTGSRAVALYGGPVPLTFGNYGHVGNNASLPGSNLGVDLMNGMSFARGSRYHISALDLAILGDTGFAIGGQMLGAALAAQASEAAVPFAVEVPEPSTYALMLAGLGVIAWARRRAARRQSRP
jgi:hypothetical protein